MRLLQFYSSREVALGVGVALDRSIQGPQHEE